MGKAVTHPSGNVIVQERPAPPVPERDVGDGDGLVIGAGRQAGNAVTPSSPAGIEVSKRTVSLYIAEEQQILRDAYTSYVRNQPCLVVVGATDDTSSEALLQAATELAPDALLVGTKTLKPATVNSLQLLREACPKVGLVLLFAFYDVHGIKALRTFSRNASAGCAYLLKHTIDTGAQLVQTINAVAEGRMIIDPMVMEELFKSGEAGQGRLKELTPRTREVLGWLAKGLRNESIAELLSRDVKTVERHINNIYAALQVDDDTSKHPRVYATLVYLRAMGLLSTEQLSE